MQFVRTGGYLIYWVLLLLLFRLSFESRKDYLFVAYHHHKSLEIPPELG